MSESYIISDGEENIVCYDYEDPYLDDLFTSDKYTLFLSKVDADIALDEIKKDKSIPNAEKLKVYSQDEIGKIMEDLRSYYHTLDYIDFY